MAKEIEERFLVDPKKWTPQNKKVIPIKQGYLSDDRYRTVRIRLNEADQNAWLTVKGVTEGNSRDEFEYSVPYSDALPMYDMSLSKIDKQRHIEIHAGKTWEIDIFSDGLILAEIELESIGEAFDKPDFIAECVTDDPSYANSNLASPNIDKRMKEAGMFSMEEMLEGGSPFMMHAGVTDLNTFEQWLEMRLAEFTRSQARIMLDKQEDDEMFEWHLAHRATLAEVMGNYKKATGR